MLRFDPPSFNIMGKGLRFLTKDKKSAQYRVSLHAVYLESTKGV